MATSDVTTKRCTRCKQAYPATPEYFYRHTRSSDGLQCWCKTCKSLSEGHKPLSMIPVAKAGNKICPKCGEEYAANAENFGSHKGRPDGLGAWCKSCKKASDKSYSHGNRAKIVARQKQWYAKQPDYEKLRYARSPNKRLGVKAAWHRRRARKLNASGTHTASDVRKQLERQHGRCYWCNVKLGDTYHVDHVIPLSRGGDDGPHNIVAACATCNLSKGSKLPHEWCGRFA